MTRASDQLSPEDAIDQMIPEALVCRDLSHNWAPYFVTRWRGGAGFERGLRCSTCSTVRVESLDRIGRLIPNSRRYEYAEGYCVKGAGRIDADFRAAVRLASMLRSPHLQTKRPPKD